MLALGWWLSSSCSVCRRMSYSVWRRWSPRYSAAAPASPAPGSSGRRSSEYRRSNTAFVFSVCTFRTWGWHGNSVQSFSYKFLWGYDSFLVCYGDIVFLSILRKQLIKVVTLFAGKKSCVWKMLIKICQINIKKLMKTGCKTGALILQGGMCLRLLNDLVF